MAFGTKINKGGFQARFYPGDFTFIDTCFFLDSVRFSISRSYSFWPSTIATRSSSGCVALISMRFIIFSLIPVGSTCEKSRSNSLLCQRCQSQNCEHQKEKRPTSVGASNEELKCGSQQTKSKVQRGRIT